MSDDINQKLGPTNNFPEDKISESDEGELRLAVGVHKNNVIIEFGSPVAWIGMGKEQALALAQSIINKANTLS